MSNAELRKNYKCNEETDYFNRAGHDCYNNDGSMVETILISLVVIAIIYLIIYFIKKRRAKKKTDTSGEKAEEIKTKTIKANRS